jgi:hypothetical protein
MDSCVYKIEEIYFDKPIFNNIIDCTYILLCCGEKPKRLDNVLKNIKILQPTKKVKLVYNKGFDNCKFSKSINHDLINMQTFIFNDSIKNRYDRILYLEDDFELKEKINQKDIDNIINFIQLKNPDVYGLGNISFPKINYIFNKSQKVIGNFLGCAHAMIYNKKYMFKYIDFINNYKEQEKLGIDFIPSQINNLEVYRYYKPLIYQKFPETENQTNGWKNQMGNFIAIISIFFIKLLRLDKNIEPGYTIFYIFPYIIYFLLLLLIVLIIIIIYKKNKN